MDTMQFLNAKLMDNSAGKKEKESAKQRAEITLLHIYWVVYTKFGPFET